MAAEQTQKLTQKLTEQQIEVIDSKHLIADKSLKKKLGHGSSADIFLAHWKLPEKTETLAVAVKKLHARKACETDLPHLLESECDILSRLGHADVIVKFYGVVIEGVWSLGIVFEYIAGGSLWELLQSDKEITPEQMLQIALSIFAGLTYIHERNVVHRDIKSPNILLDETRHSVKIGDFGISAVASNGYVTQDSFVGSVPWLAPEAYGSYGSYELSSRVPSMSCFATDVFEAGMVMYELLARAKPFWYIDTQLDHQKALLRGERPAIPTDGPPAFLELIRSCWQPDPCQRPTASMARARLSAVQRGVLVDHSTSLLSSETASGLPDKTLLEIYEMVMNDTAGDPVSVFLREGPSEAQMVRLEAIDLAPQNEPELPCDESTLNLQSAVIRALIVCELLTLDEAIVLPPVIRHMLELQVVRALFTSRLISLAEIISSYDGQMSWLPLHNVPPEIAKRIVGALPADCCVSIVDAHDDGLQKMVIALVAALPRWHKLRVGAQPIPPNKLTAIGRAVNPRRYLCLDHHLSLALMIVAIGALKEGVIFWLDPKTPSETAVAAVRALLPGRYLYLDPRTSEALAKRMARELKAECYLYVDAHTTPELLIAAASALRPGCYIYLQEDVPEATALAVAAFRFNAIVYSDDLDLSTVMFAKRLKLNRLVVMNPSIPSSIADAVISKLREGGYLCLTRKISEEKTSVISALSVGRYLYVPDIMTEALAKAALAKLPPRSVLHLSCEMSREKGVAIINALPVNCFLYVDANLSVDLAIAWVGALDKGRVLKLDPDISRDLEAVAVSALKEGCFLKLDASLSTEAITALGAGSGLYLDDSATDQAIIKNAIMALSPGRVLYLSAEISIKRARILVKKLPTGCALILADGMDEDKSFAIMTASAAATITGVYTMASLARWRFSVGESAEVLSTAVTAVAP